MAPQVDPPPDGVFTCPTWQSRICNSRGRRTGLDPRRAPRQGGPRRRPARSRPARGTDHGRRAGHRRARRFADAGSRPRRPTATRWRRDLHRRRRKRSRPRRRWSRCAMRSIGSALSIQNGLLKDELLAAAFGREQGARRARELQRGVVAVGHGALYTQQRSDRRRAGWRRLGSGPAHRRCARRKRHSCRRFGRHRRRRMDEIRGLGRTDGAVRHHAAQHVGIPLPSGRGTDPRAHRPRGRPARGGTRSEARRGPRAADSAALRGDRGTARSRSSSPSGANCGRTRRRIACRPCRTSRPGVRSSSTKRSATWSPWLGNSACRRRCWTISTACWASSPAPAERVED